jgi:hypothetical protein
MCWVVSLRWTGCVAAQRAVVSILQQGAHGMGNPMQAFRIPFPFEQKEPDYLLWGCFRSSFASSSTPAGCLLQLIHGLDAG